MRIKLSHILQQTLPEVNFFWVTRTKHEPSCAPEISFKKHKTQYLMGNKQPLVSCSTFEKIFSPIRSQSPSGVL